jgi:hypothetical protein
MLLPYRATSPNLDIQIFDLEKILIGRDHIAVAQTKRDRGYHDIDGLKWTPLFGPRAAPR